MKTYPTVQVDLGDSNKSIIVNVVKDLHINERWGNAVVVEISTVGDNVSLGIVGYESKSGTGFNRGISSKPIIYKKQFVDYAIKTKKPLGTFTIDDIIEGPN